MRLNGEWMWSLQKESQIWQVFAIRSSTLVRKNWWLQIEDLNRCHRQRPRGCRTMDTLHSRHSVMRAGNQNHYTTRVTSWLDDVWYSDVYLQSWYVWIYSKSCWSLMSDMFSIHDYFRLFSFSGSWSIGAKVWRLSARQSPKHAGYVVPMFGTACRPLTLNVAVEVSWLSTWLHCVRFFGESNSWEHLKTQTQHMATVTHGSDTFLEPVWQCMNLKARLETKTYVRLNSSWHHPDTVLQSHLSCGLRQGIVFPTQDKVRSPSMRFSNALKTPQSQLQTILLPRAPASHSLGGLNLWLTIPAAVTIDVAALLTSMHQRLALSSPSELSVSDEFLWGLILDCAWWWQKPVPQLSQKPRPRRPKPAKIFVWHSNCYSMASLAFPMSVGSARGEDAFKLAIVVALAWENADSLLKNLKTCGDTLVMEGKEFI